MNLTGTLIPLIPLLGFLIIGLTYNRMPKKITGWIGSGSVFIAFILSIIVFIHILQTKTPFEVRLFDWIRLENINIPFTFYFDQLTTVMMLIITGVGFLIHVYSIGYMREDEGYNRYFAYMNLFIFSMLLLVIGANYLILFIGWEGVGLCSYLLIGFHFKNNDYNNAAKKAFIMNRIGDLGFLLGMFMIFVQFGSLSYTEVFSKAVNYTGLTGNITWITLLLFIGAVGKSAQIPLYTWLPDAMAGPTPVSALIHAATMVTAGVYMVARSNILYALSPISLHVIGIIGLSTALMAATIAMYQNDIKKVLAYSTVSQLGYMFLALGVGAFTGGIFHLITHAFFKALLFLGAGSVIHALQGEQDIRVMGGLKTPLKKTYLIFLIATIAISGLPPFAGFFSKDEILVHAYESNTLLWILGFIGALITAFYMFRLLYVTFHGPYRGKDEVKDHIHESPRVMMIPLMILAFLTIFGGLIGIPQFLGGNHALNSFLNPVFENGVKVLDHKAELNRSTELVMMILTIVAVLGILFWARYRFVSKQRVPADDLQTKNFVVRTLYRKYYVDELYETVVIKPIEFLSKIFHQIIEIKIIDRFINNIGQFVLFTGKTSRKLQTGTIGFYLMAMVISLIIAIWFFILR
jgi:NADH-quinone oxidoreductase subunit L